MARSCGINRWSWRFPRPTAASSRTSSLVSFKQRRSVSRISGESQSPWTPEANTAQSRTSEQESIVSFVKRHGEANVLVWVILVPQDYWDCVRITEMAEGRDGGIKHQRILLVSQHVRDEFV